MTVHALPSAPAPAPGGGGGGGGGCEHASEADEDLPEDRLTDRLVLAAVRFTGRRADRVTAAELFERLEQRVSRLRIKEAMEDKEIVGAEYVPHSDGRGPAHFLGARLRGEAQLAPTTSARAQQLLSLFTITTNPSDTLLQSAAMTHVRTASNLRMSAATVRELLERAGAVFTNRARANCKGFCKVVLASPKPRIQQQVQQQVQQPSATVPTEPRPEIDLVRAAVDITGREADRVPATLLFERLERRVSKQTLQQLMRQLGAPCRHNVKRPDDVVEADCFVRALLKEQDESSGSERARKLLALVTITSNRQDAVHLVTVKRRAQDAGLQMGAAAVRDHLVRAGAVFSSNAVVDGKRSRGFLQLKLAGPA